MTVSRLAVVLCVAVGVLVAGCDNTTDVTQDPAFGDFGAIRGTWQSKVPTQLVDSGKHGFFLVLDDGTPAPPGEVRLAVLPAGTEFRIDRLIYRETFEMSYLDVTGSLTSGAYTGKRFDFAPQFFPEGMLSRARVYRGQKEVREMKWSVDPSKLERVSDKQPATMPKTQ